MTREMEAEAEVEAEAGADVGMEAEAGVSENLTSAEATAMTIADDAEWGGLPYELQDILHGRLCGEHADVETCQDVAAADAVERYPLELAGGGTLRWERGTEGKFFGRLPDGRIVYRISPRYDDEDGE